MCSTGKTTFPSPRFTAWPLAVVKRTKGRKFLSSEELGIIRSYTWHGRVVNAGAKRSFARHRALHDFNLVPVDLHGEAARGRLRGETGRQRIDRILPGEVFVLPGCVQSMLRLGQAVKRGGDFRIVLQRLRDGLLPRVIAGDVQLALGVAGNLKPQRRFDAGGLQPLLDQRAELLQRRLRSGLNRCFAGWLALRGGGLTELRKQLPKRLVLLDAAGQLDRGDACRHSRGG